MKVPPVEPSNLKRQGSEEPEATPSPKKQKAEATPSPIKHKIETALQVFEQPPEPTAAPIIATQDAPPSAMKISQLIDHTVIPSWRLEAVRPSQVNQSINDQLKVINSSLVIKLWKTSDKTMEAIIQEIPNEALQTEIWNQLRENPIFYLETVPDEHMLAQLLEQTPDVWGFCIKNNPLFVKTIADKPVLNLSFNEKSIHTLFSITQGENVVLLNNALVSKSLTLKNLIKDLSGTLNPQIEIEISQHCDLNILEMINGFSQDLTLLEIPDIETCFRIFQIAVWLDIPELFPIIDEFLEVHLEPLNPQLIGLPIHELLELSNFQDLEGEQATLAEQHFYQAMNAAFNADFKDIILWYTYNDLPQAHAVAQEQIQAWIQSEPNDPASVVVKCQLLAKGGLHLDTLNLSFGTFTDEHVNAIIDCQPNIQELNISNTQITGNIHLERLLKLTSLQIYSNANLTNQLGPHLVGLPLKFLNLSNCPLLTDAIGESFVGLPLQYLNMTMCNLTNAFGQHLTNLPLETLIMIACTELTDDFGLHIANSPIKNLQMSDCTLTNAFGQYVAQMQQLISLDMSRTQINDLFGEHLIGKALKVLLVADCNLTDAFGEHLVDLPLEMLDISYCDELTNAFRLIIARLPLLSSLNVSGCSHLTNEFGQSLPGLINLRWLDLSECVEIDDQFSQYLVGLPLHTLNVASCHVLTNAFIQGLVNLPLVKLDLSQCPLFTDGLALSIAQLVQLRALRVVGCNGLTPAFHQAIAGLPIVNINGENLFLIPPN